MSYCSKSFMPWMLSIFMLSGGSFTVSGSLVACTMEHRRGESKASWAAHACTWHLPRHPPSGSYRTISIRVLPGSYWCCVHMSMSTCPEVEFVCGARLRDRVWLGLGLRKRVSRFVQPQVSHYFFVSCYGLGALLLVFIVVHLQTTEGQLSGG